MNDRVELQAEVAASRDLVFPLVATADGLRRWLDAASLDVRVGGELRATLRDAQAVGRVLALDPPQHISFTWDWLERPLGAASVVAFDAIDHGARTWVTLRHVGLPTPEQVDLHDQMWRYWLGRFVE
ncbi:MAG TPA: SRPBCC domain-containing protein, partial [Candidatus Limnocylindrales bacterium]